MLMPDLGTHQTIQFRDGNKVVVILITHRNHRISLLWMRGTTIYLTVLSWNWNVVLFVSLFKTKIYLILFSNICCGQNLASQPSIIWKSLLLGIMTLTFYFFLSVQQPFIWKILALFSKSLLSNGTFVDASWVSWFKLILNSWMLLDTKQ